MGEVVTQLQPPQSTALTPMEVLNNAITNGANVETLEKLMALQERWEANQARKAFEEAIAQAKEELPTIVKNRHVGYDSKKAEAGRTEYSHEDFAQIDKAVKPVLAKHGLSYRFRTASPPDAPITVTCIIAHRLGHSEENSLQGPRDVSGSKNPIQAIGSTVTYLQRYTLKAALGIAVEADDDGQSSGAPIKPEKVLNPETGRMVNPSSPHQLRKKGAWQRFESTIRAIRDLDELESWWTDGSTQAEIELQPKEWQAQAADEYEKRREALGGLPR